MVLSHLRAVHSNDPGFNVTCGIKGCAVTLKSFRSLYQHIYRKHRDSGIIERRYLQPDKISAPIEDAPEVETNLVEYLGNYYL